MPTNTVKFDQTELSELLAKTISTLDDDASEELNEIEDTLFDMFDDPNLHNLNLKLLTTDQVLLLPVTTLSIFGNDIWDFSEDQDEYGSLAGTNIFHFDGCPSESLKYTLKCWLFYWLPQHNNTRINTFEGTFRIIKRFFFLLYEACEVYREHSVLSSIKTISDLNEKDIEACFKSINTWNKSAAFNIGMHLQGIAGTAMRNSMIPLSQCFSFDIFVGKRFTDVFPRWDAQPWQPIPQKALYPLAQTSMAILRDISEDIIMLNDSYWEERNLHSKAFLAPFSKILRAHKFAILWDDKPWHTLKKSAQVGTYKIGFLGSWVRLLRSAAMIIISLCLGLRSSELRSLKVGCAKMINDTEAEIEVTVFKTSKSANGSKVTLPCPINAYNAVKTLERLLKQRRKSLSSDYLLVGVTSTKKNRITKGTVNHAIRYFCDWLGVKHIHHQFRKTIANYIIHKDPHSLDLIKMLFSHSSIEMTLRYVLHIQTISREIKLLLIKENMEVVVELMESASKGSISSKNRDHIILFMQNEKTFLRGETLHNRGRSLMSYVHSLLEDGVTLLRRTPLAICVCEASPTERCSCRKDTDPAELQKLPNVANCQPYMCSGSIFTELNEPEIRNDIEFYEWVLQQGQLKNIERVKEYEKLLSRLYEIMAPSIVGESI